MKNVIGVFLNDGNDDGDDGDISHDGDDEYEYDMILLIVFLNV